MIKIIFLCHGNICRSPMAEFIMKSIVDGDYNNEYYYITSKALTYDEIDNDMYYMAKDILKKYQVPFTKRKASIFKKADYDNFDYIVVMDEENIRDIKEIIGSDPKGKVRKLLSFVNEYDRIDIADPWYTKNFERAYADIYYGCMSMYAKLELMREGKRKNV